MKTTLILILICLLCLAGFLFYMAMRKKSKVKRPSLESSSLANLPTIKNARSGDTLILSGASENYEDVSLTVDRMNRYEVDSDSWYELSGLWSGKRIFLEWCEDDELEVGIQRKTGLGIEDIGITEEDLSRMDDQRSRSNFIEYDGQKWYYRESSEVGYFKDDGPEGEGFYMWQFESDDFQLFVEKYEVDPFEVGISEKINPSRIKVFRA